MGQLYWEDTYELVLALMEAYGEVDLDALGLQQLGEMVMRLPDFADDPLLVNADILTDILREWYEECNP